LSKADAVIASTNSTRRLLVDLLGVSEERIAVIPYGIDDAFHRARWSPPTDSLRVLHVGSTAPYKRIDLVIDTVIGLTALHPNVELVRAGPPLPLDLARRVIAAGVHLTQHIDRLDGSLRTPSEQAAIYSQATVLLHPSEYEGFGLPVAEALAVGLPVVASNIETLREVSGGHAEHVEGSAEALGASLTRLVSDPTMMKQMSAAGKQWAKRFRWAPYATSLNGVYRAVTESRYKPGDPAVTAMVDRNRAVAGRPTRLSPHK
jgi:glycosyltransferase involved in cell wall biosynthesis